jgi:predicted nucleic acid-binding protein
MSDQALVADTSALIHLMEGHAEAGRWMLEKEVHISVATEIELRTMSAIKRNASEVIQRTLAMCSIWDISPSIKDRCIHFRSTHRLKLADALVAATAASLNLPLLTSDKDFSKLKGVLDVRLLSA